MTNEVFAAGFGAYMYGGGEKGAARGVYEFRKANAEQVREARNQLVQYESVERNTEQMVKNYFSPFTNHGGRPKTKQIEMMAKHFHEQAEIQYEVNRDIEVIVSRLHATEPGTQGKQSKR